MKKGEIILTEVDYRALVARAGRAESLAGTVISVGAALQRALAKGFLDDKKIRDIIISKLIERIDGVFQEEVQ